MTFKIEGGSYRPSVPITIVRTLDESLDMAHVMIPHTTRREPFVPFSFAELDGERWLVGADVPTEVKGLRGRWNHDITLVEETKRLETMFISGKVITKHEYRDYESEVKPPQFELVAVHGLLDEDEALKDISPENIGVNTITGIPFSLNSTQKVRGKGAYTQGEIASYEEYVNLYASKPHALWIETNGEVIAYTDSLTEDLVITDDVLERYVGYILDVRYFFPFAWTDLVGGTTVFYELSYTVTPLIMPDRLTNKTAREAVEELIADAEQLRYKDSPRITLDPDEAARLDAIEAPEDAFSQGMTLFEALLKVGDWDGVGGIPKIQRDVLTFQRWGATEVTAIEGRVISVQDSATADTYCSTLESAAANMVDEIGNAVADPFSGGFGTVRTEDGAVVIEDGTIMIQTSFPIWQVTKLTLGWVGGKIRNVGGDITPYVYEQTEYDLLSDFALAGFPNSKAYAIYYTKGAPGIRGLSFVPRTFSGDMGWMHYNAIEYILQAKFGIKPRLSSEDIVNLNFRVEYVPYISTRIRQHKTRVNGIEAALSYGQGGAVIAARTYGNHLRARAQMLGLPEKTVQVISPISARLPVPGQRVDGINYVGTVTTEYYPTYRRSQITMSPNYNRINQFIEVKKDLRQFEIPMEGSTERNVMHEDFIVLGEYEGKFPTMISPAVQDAVITALMGGGTSAEISAAVLSTSNKPDKTDGTQVILPVVKTAVGNSVLFYARYKNNYSAGSVSEANPEKSEASRLQRDVRYTDLYGNARYLHMDLMTGAAIRTTDIRTAHNVPLTAGVEMGRTMVSTADKPMMLCKDAREAVSLTYQIHYVTNTDMIIGQEMAARAPYLAYKDYSPAVVYFYPSYINPLTGESDAADGHAYALTSGEYLGVRYVERPGNAPGHKAWAVKQDGAFLFGGNSPMPERIFFNFRDKLREAEWSTDEDRRENVFVTVTTANASHVNLTDYLERGGTYRDSFRAADGYILPASISVKVGGVPLSVTKYTWDRKTGVLEIPDVVDNLEISVFAVDNSFTVTTELTFWDQYGNDMLYVEKSVGIYPYGFRIVVPQIVQHLHEGEMRDFSTGKETYTVTVTGDMKISEDYYLVVLTPTPPPIPIPPDPIPPDPPIPIPPDPDPTIYYDVNITLEYWDQWQNDHRFDEYISGRYQAGSVITIPGTVVRNDVTYLLEGTGADIEIKVYRDITTSYVYTEKSTQQYTVDIDVDFWDEWANDLLFSESFSEQYEVGATIVIPATVTRMYNGEERVFELSQGVDVTITVEGYTRRSFSYTLRP